MPWKDTSPVTEREHFINDYLTGDDSVSESCRRCRISRKTGDTWIDRSMAGCELADRSSRPHHSPRAVAAWLEDAIVQAGKQRPRWGPRKLRQAMLRANPKVDLPSVSTFALIIRRNGLVRPRRRRRTTPRHTAPRAHAQ